MKIKCRNCKSQKLNKVIYIGKQVVSSIFPKTKPKSSKKYSLALYECKKCKLVQLGKSIPLGNMYGETYGYRSSLSRLMVNHLKRKFLRLKKMLSLKKNSNILDIGSSDSTFLNFFSNEKKGYSCFGIDPSAKKYTKYYNKDVNLIVDYFSAKSVNTRLNSINLRNASGGASYATFTNGGAAVLKWNNTDRLETTTAGITVTGTVNATAFSGDGSALSNLPGISTTHVRSETLTVSGVTTFTGDVNGSSTNIALFGADEDLKIYHSGADSFISDQGTGQLKILTSTLSVKNAGDSNVGLEVVPGSHTKLFFNGSNKIETTNTGAVVTGALTANSFVGDGSGLTNVVGSGSGVIVKDDGSTVGTAGTFDFTSPINITPLSAGITTVGIDTNQFNVNNLDVSGISTFAGNISLAEKIVHTNDSNTSINFPSLDTISFITGGGTRLQVGPVGQLGIAGATYGNPGQVLTSQGSGSIVTWADLPNNVGITTNITGSFTATAGSPSEIHSFVYGNNDRVVEYTILIEQGPSFQSLKVLASRLGSTIHSTQFAVIFNNSLLATFDVIISSSNIRLRAIPETGVTGTIAYRIKREVM